MALNKTKQNANPGPSLEVKVAYLSRTDSYIEHTSLVEALETHMSWVFMTERFVYKLKKPVRYSFLNFNTLDARHRNCQEEVRLNRRLAPEVYLGIVPLTLDKSDHLQLDGSGQVVEWLVMMRRLPAERMLDHLIQKQQVRKQDIRQLGRKLACFYHHTQAISITPDAYRQRLQRDIHADHEALSEHDHNVSANQLNQIIGAQLELLNRLPELFDQRVEEKRVVEAHGDLRPEHICLVEDPVFIDCLEFNREFRILDPAHELAYLAMECQFAGADFIGPIIFETYCRETGDDPPQTLIHFYKACRATLRAKLAIWHIKDHEADEHAKWINRANAYLQLAEEFSALL